MPHTVSRRMLCLFFVWFISCPLLADDYRYHHESVLGTSLELTIRANSEASADKAEAAVLHEIDRLSCIYSHYDPSSEFSRFLLLGKGQGLDVSPELYEALQRCERWMATSSGAFQPAAEHLAKIWRQAEATQSLPRSSILKSAIVAMNQTHWTCVGDSTRIVRTSSTSLTLNAIAKGLILDQAAELACRQSGVQGVMINIGGDIRLAGSINSCVLLAAPHADALGAKPLSRLNLTTGAIATSGRSERGFKIRGHWYSHLLDPRTGKPATEIASATVIAGNAATADVLATVCNILAPQDSLALVESLPGVECLLVSAQGDLLTSKGFPERNTLATSIGRSFQPAQRVEKSLLVEFELSKPDNARRYRRPYVAIWIEDSQGFPVKTLSLFVMKNAPGPRWIRDLRRWYSGDQMRRLVDQQDLIDTISKPTRNPGKYKVQWDGKDNAGKPLADGKYTLLLEAAREHGTYQLIKFPFQWGGKPFQEDLKGNLEIGSARVTYSAGKTP